ncbi:hypothetical protein FZW96_15875 [Bacillus sp. BGMRC 2118]|nr:hypothetical protein FZW96_15875 [Bacillus sp. BGMRC 2118]
MEELSFHKEDENLIIMNNSSTLFPFVEILLDGQYLGAFTLDTKVSIPLSKTKETYSVLLVGYKTSEEGTQAFNYKHILNSRNDYRKVELSQDYQPGDILVACDNVNGLPYGYMGHSAIVVDNENIIEAVITEPIVRKVPIKQLTDYHPIHAHFRPKDAELGKNAASYAEKYLQIYKENREKGIDWPYFYFSLKTPLEDEWTYIYCSKLVWLSYHFGANITMENDHLWFAPEDLYTVLSHSKDFDLIYKHSNYQFIIDM